MNVLPQASAADVARSGPRVAVLPVGSFEQHGDHLPLSTDTLIATTIAEQICDRYGLLCLPPVTISCSHEHEGMPGLPGTVSISATTLTAVIDDVRRSLARAGIDRLVLVNAHGGNYVLANFAQEANVAGPAVALFPGAADWKAARAEAGLMSSHGADMHGGELETSILLHAAPDAVHETYTRNDHDAPDREHLTLLGMKAYTPNGIIGFPSQATATKGAAVLGTLVARFAHHLEVILTGATARPAHA
ncbi:creatininase family protein [Myceligenerans cantabricum]